MSRYARLVDNEYRPLREAACEAFMRGDVDAFVANCEKLRAMVRDRDEFGDKLMRRLRHRSPVMPAIIPRGGPINWSSVTMEEVSGAV